MSADGYLRWHDNGGTFFLLDQVYFDGRFYTCLGEVGGLSIQDSDGVSVVESHAGTALVLAPFRGDGAPLVGDRKTFSVTMPADDEEDYRAFRTSRSRGRAVDLCVGDWITESFQAQSGRTFGLYRRSADGVLPGFPGVSLAPRFFVGGTENPDAASVSGSRVTFAIDGEVQVYYMPVYRIAVASFGLNLEDVNVASVVAQLDEVGVPDLSLG